MRILIITNLYPSSSKIDDQTGVMLLHNFAKFWSKDHDVAVLNPHSYNLLEVHKIFRKDLTARFQLDEIDIINERVLRLPIDNLQVRKFVRIVEELGSFDYIIACLPVGLEITHYVSKKLKIPYFVYLHNTDFHRSGVSKGSINKKYKRFLNDAQGTMFVSSRLKNKFQEALPGLDDFLLPGGISDSWKENQIQRTFSTSGLKLIASAKLVKQKNIELILHALEGLEEINYTLDVAGDGEYRPYLEKIVADQSNLTKNVTFKGMVDHKEMKDLFDQSDFMILLSTNESFGLVYIEAMARGCIPIGTKNEGIDGVIIHEQNGFLCLPDTASVRKLLKEVSDYTPQQLVDISLNAMETANKYLYTKLAQSFIEFADTKLNRV